MTQDKNQPAVTVRDIHKEFVLPQHKSTSIKSKFINIVKRNDKTIQKVLDGVSFEVQKGDFFGIVGRNGSGKSTLLKLLAGVYTPTSGEISLNGKLTPFIELGVGFNPELSGRDNVYLNGALLGFTRKQMDEMYEEIVAFAELEPFMDQKLKNYSSGMQVRLAFSIAIKAKNEILIFDEVLAVGDEAFQRKCLDVFEKYKRDKQTVILVTHEMETVKKFCNKALLLNQGEILKIGDPREVANTYSELNQQQIDNETARANSTKKVAKLHLEIGDENRKPKQSYKIDETITCTVSWPQLDDVESVGINIFKESGEHITGLNSKQSPSKNWERSKSLSIRFKLGVTTGKYYLTAEAFGRDKRTLELVLEGPQFSVVSKDKSLTWSGLVNLEHDWLDT